MSIKEKLEEAGYGTEDLFMPEEYDNAFIGIAMTDWHYNRPVYDIAKLTDVKELEVPEGMKAPIIVTMLSDLKEYDLTDYVRFSPEGLDKSILGITEEGQVVYEYECLLECMMEVEDWDSETAADWISFNTLRDYSYRDQGPVVYQSMEHILE